MFGENCWVEQLLVLVILKTQVFTQVFLLVALYISFPYNDRMETH